MRLPKSINVGGIEKPKFRLRMLPSPKRVEERINSMLLYFEMEFGDEYLLEPIISFLDRVSKEPVPKKLMPYSIRSILYQICPLLSEYDGFDWNDLCITKRETKDCILASGLPKKELKCLGLNELLDACQSDSERVFLLSYLTEAFLANSGGEFPMAIPQVWLGRDMRVDFAIFIPKNNECEGIVVEIGTLSIDKPTKIKSLGFEFYQVDKHQLKEDTINIVSEVYNRLKNLKDSKYGISLAFHYP